jgi:hypothetical protein
MRSLVLLPFLLGLAFIAACIETDISVPGFPQMMAYFSVTEAEVQLTMSLNFLMMSSGTKTHNLPCPIILFPVLKAVVEAVFPPLPKLDFGWDEAIAFPIRGTGYIFALV